MVCGMNWPNWCVVLIGQTGVWYELAKLVCGLDWGADLKTFINPGLDWGADFKTFINPGLDWGADLKTFINPGLDWGADLKTDNLCLIPHVSKTGSSLFSQPVYEGIDDNRTG
ncbi:hypothetical protein DPMN_128742 [Dreissena polymorpha]|uniref:Uncharacterized protein n=1 Tax=Dreissena polymorpha TaxID=45954 RepID=A0A9D4H3J0_DREPO|nr:hypothetical protein DPMN_128742 [Dreissena polymorpha]